MNKTKEEIEKQEEKHDFIGKYDLGDAAGPDASGLYEHDFINRLIVPILYHSDGWDDVFNLSKWQYVRRFIVNKDYLDKSDAEKEKLVNEISAELAGQDLFNIEYELIKVSVFRYMNTFEYMSTEGRDEYTRYTLTTTGLEWLMEINNDY